MIRRRLDVVMVERGMVSSRTQAQRLIQAGQVHLQIAGKKIQAVKSAEVSDECLIVIDDIAGSDFRRFVSRAGLKLENAFQRIEKSSPTYSVEGFNCLDVGQSTGGFTDCLLQRGAAKVVGLDVGHSQVHPKIAADARVVVLEKLNARELAKTPRFLKQLPLSGFELVVVDVSFISLTQVLPQLIAYADQILALVKPQFEVGPAGLGKGGIVTDESLFVEVEKKVKNLLVDLDWEILDYFESSLKGSDGNQEFFIWSRKLAKG